MTVPTSDSASTRPLHPPLKINAVVATLAEDGVGAAQVLAGTGLSAAMLHDAATRVSVQQFRRVYRNARALSADPGLGFRIGARLRVSSYGLYGYALMCMATLREAVEFSRRHAALAGEVTTLHWREEGDALVYEIPSPQALLHFGFEPALAGFMTEAHIAGLAALHADVMGPDCVPARVLLVGAAPPHAALYREHLRCTVEFDQAANAMHYPAAWLDRAPRLANPLAASALRQSCTTLLAELQRASGVAGQVAQALAERPGEFPGAEAIAARLHMTPRTLRRRLEAEGTSYQQLLADVRRSLAIDYLKGTAMSTEDIAGALGFSDAASFRHAFRRWTLKSPSEFRRPS